MYLVRVQPHSNRSGLSRSRLGSKKFANLINEKSNNKIDYVFGLRIVKNLKKSIKTKIILFVILGVLDDDVDIINRFRSPKNLRNKKNRDKNELRLHL